MQLDPQTSVGQIVLDYPQAVRAFESFGIDYCCGGKRPLAEACRVANVSVELVLDRLDGPATETRVGEDYWKSAPLIELADHIVSRHHGYVRQESQMLKDLAAKVVARHGTRHPELARIAHLFDTVADDLASHMLKEEQVLFPMIGRMEESSQNLPCSVQFPIRQMMVEHDAAGESTSAIRALASGYHPPADACASFRALYQGLEEFEKDLHRHVHLENNILFPRAMQMEQRVRENAGVRA
jgi:regulator of cell morphogenesis and NO signaling